MEALIMFFGAIFVGVGVIFAGAVFSGTIVYFIWPTVMVTVFGAPALTWWQSVCLTWLAAILLKSSTTVEKKE